MGNATGDTDQAEDEGVEPAVAALEAVLVADIGGDKGGGDVEDQLDYCDGIVGVPHCELVTE